MPSPSRLSRLPAGVAGVLAVLLVTGWAANHFAAVLPVLSDREGLSETLLDGVFGLYAVGLLPGLFGGGALSDRVGRPRVVLPGALVTAVGTVVLLLSHAPAGLLVGRLVVGLGAGLTFGAGTAWAADLGGAAGTVLAGMFLTAGFGVGPLVSGALEQWAAYPLQLPFVLSLALSLGAVTIALVRSVPPTRKHLESSAGPAQASSEHSTRDALAWSLPVGVLVFASMVTAIVTLATRLSQRYDGPVFIGLAAFLGLGTGIAVQTLARHRRWGPRAGVAGAVCSALGFALVAVAGAEVGLPLLVAVCLLMGSAYGLCLREGLLDVETLAPPSRRGLLTGVFYVVTYVGFGLPVLLDAIEPWARTTPPVVVLAVVAVVVALVRTGQMRRGHPGRH